MGFQLPAYDEAKAKFAEHVVALRGKHSAAKIDELPDHRRIQVQFLNAVIDELDNGIKPSQEKARILTGFMHIIHAEICDNSGSGSLLRKALHDAMSVDEKNVIDPNSEVAIIKAAMKFYVSIVFESGFTTEKLLEDHAFSKIKGLDLPAFEVRAIDMQNTASKVVFSEAHQNQKKMLQEREEAARKKEGGGHGWLPSISMFGGSNKKDEDSHKKGPDAHQVKSVAPNHM
ncbi:hypothetical protein [Legionella spiritensis]|uniref:Substrate of the Dot/Icm secretion system n=1 Tax=Legionella spiritensis TaxID=452 RepID=A0A0W0Z5S1_LEGSP|nr:hypothetical protein [Legionella spiritensis]KTD64504.1 substrate of the Dot/Icm secretion system [Legionella spiritensis]SNV33197.1 Dot/Icm secretion system substrate [Legionella spiritensis]VEG92354.1 Dot/Icm secretion system substrate [Legionella spiritensis]